jgi:cytochrome oxidase Cu insertion factor (SCO1/SenC/PrrC family)
MAFFNPGSLSMRYLLIHTFLFIAVMIIPTGCNSSNSTSSRESFSSPDPQIEADDINGQRFKLSDFRGKVVLLDFWATY